MGVPSALERFQLVNLDTGETLAGQFHAQSLRLSASARWAVSTALNRQHGITQFLNGENDVVSFEALFHQTNINDTKPFDRVNLLRTWVQRADSTARPPVLNFWAGDGHLQQTCVLESLEVEYGTPNSRGNLRDATVRLTLRQYHPFNLTEEEVTDTRYHHVGERDYYEALAQREYGNPLFGVGLRQRNPTIPVPQPGDVIPLPALAGIRAAQVTQTSIQLKGAFGRKETPQRALRIAVLERLSTPYVSHVVR